MELPHVLGMKGIPQGNPFNINPMKVEEDDKHRIGINWGASWVSQHMDRTCALAELLPLSKISSANLFSLQKGAHQKQLYPPPTGMEVCDIAPHLTDFLDTATVLMSMDAIVTTDNVVANLSCMLGLPTFVLVPKCSDWRWGECGKSTWFPSARVYQQDNVGEWGPPIARLTNDLGAYLNQLGKLENNEMEASHAEV
jgi:hypothetical protein